MKNLAFLFLGIVFGIVMTKSEAISWFRIYEMFRLESIHMYGIIGVAVAVGSLGIYLMQKMKFLTRTGNEVKYTKNIPLNFRRHLLSGTIFGLGWGLMGACPGPIYVMIGQGYTIMIVVLFGALLGTILYGLTKEKLPH